MIPGLGVHKTPGGKSRRARSSARGPGLAAVPRPSLADLRFFLPWCPVRASQKCRSPSRSSQAGCGAQPVQPWPRPLARASAPSHPSSPSAHPRRPCGRDLHVYEVPQTMPAVRAMKARSLVARARLKSPKVGPLESQDADAGR